MRYFLMRYFRLLPTSSSRFKTTDLSYVHPDQSTPNSRQIADALGIVGNKLPT